MSEWIEVGPVDEVRRRKRIVIDDIEAPILVYTYEDTIRAMANICIHRDRELVKGVILRGRLVCPGHQWAFDVNTGWEAVKQQCQPVHAVRIVDDVVYVSAASTICAAPPAAS
ncbi:MAG: Rieske 2Fe-2S domain-containing protein [Ilumatobacteraceae bacterium]